MRTQLQVQQHKLCSAHTPHSSEGVVVPLVSTLKKAKNTLKDHSSQMRLENQIIASLRHENTRGLLAMLQAGMVGVSSAVEPKSVCKAAEHSAQPGTG